MIWAIAGAVCCVCSVSFLLTTMFGLMNMGGGGDPTTGKPYAEFLSREIKNKKANIQTVVVVLRRPPVAGVAGTQTYAIPAKVQDKSYWVVWVDADGLFRGRDSYYRELQPLNIMHAGVVVEYQNFFTEYKA